MGTKKSGKPKDDPVSSGPCPRCMGEAKPTGIFVPRLVSVGFKQTWEWTPQHWCPSCTLSEGKQMTWLVERPTSSEIAEAVRIYRHLVNCGQAPKLSSYFSKTLLTNRHDLPLGCPRPPWE